MDLLFLAMIIFFVINLMVGIDNYQDEEYASACLSFFVCGFMLSTMLGFIISQLTK